MLVRVSILSIFLMSSSLFSMEFVLDMKSECAEIDLNDTTGKTNCISSLQSWKIFAKEHESLDGYEVLSKAVAEYQQAYEIETDVLILPEVIAIWSRAQGSEGYNREVSRMHALLRGGADARDRAELTNLQNLCLKKAYARLIEKQQELCDKQKSFVRMYQWGIVAPIIAGVFLITWIFEMTYLIKI